MESHRYEPTASDFPVTSPSLMLRVSASIKDVNRGRMVAARPGRPDYDASLRPSEAGTPGKRLLTCVKCWLVVSTRIRLLFLCQRFQGLISVALLVVAAAVIPESRAAFFQSATLENIPAQLAVPGALAVGMTFVILTGGIDLSVGSMMALLNVVAAQWASSGQPLHVVLPYVLFLGLALGAVTGLVVAYTRMQPFVVTLAAMVSLRGIAFLYTKNNISGFPPIFDPLESRWGDVPMQAVLLAAMVLCGWSFLTKTTYGRYVYAVGGNEEAARLSGVPVRRVKVMAYALNGLCVAVAALLLTARLDNGEPGGSIGMELDAIAAVVVGGASLVGG
ncbi:MAG: ABC transporter permease, partial [Armatimonadetes bacterium]|nr:ABC transporter permease [Armatimonadota bacterium]